MIPVQLHNGWRFVLVKPRTKEAFEKDWQNTANYLYNDPKLTAHIQAGGNYGVLAGSHQAIVETDDSGLEELIRRDLPATFTVQSPGHNSRHFYYDYTGEPKTIAILDRTRPKDNQNIGHVKIGSAYVVGPGSTHPNGKTYRICDDRPIAKITEADLRRVLAPFISKRAKAAEVAEGRRQRSNVDFDILQLVNTTRLSRQGHEYFGPHPVHGSETRHNFWVNPVENVWYCFRCNTGGGPLSLLAVLERIIDCNDCKDEGFRGDDFKKTLALAKERGLIKKPAPPKLQVLTEDVPPAPPIGLTEATKPDEAAEAILQTFRLATFEDTDEILVYKEGVYRVGGEALIARTLEANFHGAELDHVSNNHFLNEVLGHVERRTYIKPDIFDRDPNILNLENGLFNVNSCELKHHTPDYPSLAKLPVKYDPAAECPGWTRFVSQVFHPEDIDAVQEFCGSLLEKHYKTQKAWLQAGEGANGKDTLDRVLTALLGPENVAHRSLQDLENNRFAKAELFGKLANIYSDLSDVALKTTGSFKTLTGEGSLAAEKKFQNGFTFGNYAKLIFSCNKIPLSPDDSDAFFRRWLITTFPNVFLDKKADPNLVAKLTTPEELSGILNWALEGLRRLHAQNWHLSNCKSVEEVRQDYIRKSDPVKAFLLDCVLPEPEGTVGKQELYQAFIKYCKGKKLPSPTSDTFYKRLPMAGIPITSVKLNVQGNRIPAFKGLFLREEKDWGKERDQWNEEAPADKGKLDPHLRREEGGLPGLPRPNDAGKSTQSIQSGAPPPKVEAGICASCGQQGNVRLDPHGQYLLCEAHYPDQPREGS